MTFSQLAYEINEMVKANGLNILNREELSRLERDYRDMFQRECEFIPPFEVDMYGRVHLEDYI